MTLPAATTGGDTRSPRQVSQLNGTAVGRCGQYATGTATGRYYLADHDRHRIRDTLPSVSAGRG